MKVFDEEGCFDPEAIRSMEWDAVKDEEIIDVLHDNPEFILLIDNWRINEDIIKGCCASHMVVMGVNPYLLVDENHHDTIRNYLNNNQYELVDIFEEEIKSFKKRNSMRVILHNSHVKYFSTNRA